MTSASQAFRQVGESPPIVGKITADSAIDLNNHELHGIGDITRLAIDEQNSARAEQEGNDASDSALLRVAQNSALPSSFRIPFLIEFLWIFHQLGGRLKHFRL